VYDHARAVGAAPTQAEDDEEKPWIALYRAFLEWLDRFAAAAELPPPPSPGTQHGWALAHIWFHLTQRDRARTQILTTGMPRIFIAALKRVFETIELEENPSGLFRQGEVSKELIVLLGPEPKNSAKILARWRNCAETIQLVDDTSTEGIHAPAAWQDGPHATVMITN
jgi:hypothetical protein